MDHKAAVETLRNGVKSLSDSDTFKAYLETRAKFHAYSWHNTMMIFFQRKDATHVAGFNRWKDLGRFVKKGEKGIAIFAPMMYAKKDQSTGEKTGEVLRGFRVVHVFDIAQTDGKTLPEAPMPKELTGEEGSEIFEAMAEFATRGGLNVLREFDGFSDDRKGDFCREAKQIRIRAGLSPLQAAKTLAHECSHWILHSQPAGAALGREIKETEAEAAAFIALARVGLKMDEYSFAYIAHWSGGDMKTLEESLSRIERAAEEIVHAIESRTVSLVS